MAACIAVRENKWCWFTMSDEGKRVVELTTLMKYLTGQKGDLALASLLCRCNHHGPLGTVPSCIVGLTTLPFMDHYAEKPMPAATAEGLLWLMSEMDEDLLNVNRGFLGDILVELGSSANGAVMARSRYPVLKMIDGSDDAVHLVLRDGDVPRCVLYSLLKIFAPKYDPSFLLNHRGLEVYLLELGVNFPEDLVSDHSIEVRTQDEEATMTDAFKCDAIQPYERQLAAKSCGIAVGTCAYDDGAAVLLIDFPVMMLVLLRLKITKAWYPQVDSFYQGIVLMGGTEDEALAMEQHWRFERNARPSSFFLKSFGLVDDLETMASSNNQLQWEDNEVLHLRKKVAVRALQAQLARHNFELTEQQALVWRLLDDKRRTNMVSKVIAYELARRVDPDVATLQRIKDDVLSAALTISREPLDKFPKSEDASDKNY